MNKVVLVGHCGMDEQSLRATVTQAVGEQVKIVAANDDQSLVRHLGPGVVLLINRALDGWFSVEDGIAMIRLLNKVTPRPTMLLVSNYADAQAQAVAAGAEPGFGKMQLRDPATIEVLRHAIAEASSQSAV